MNDVNTNQTIIYMEATEWLRLVQYSVSTVRWLLCVYKLKTINTLTACFLHAIFNSCIFLSDCYLYNFFKYCKRTFVSEYTVPVHINTNCYLCLFVLFINSSQCRIHDTDNKWKTWLKTNLLLCFCASFLFFCLLHLTELTNCWFTDYQYDYVFLNL